MKKTLLLLIASILLAGCTARATGTVVPAISAPSSTATHRPRPTATIPPPSTQEPTQTPDPGSATREAALESCRGNGPDNVDKFVHQAYSATRFWSATVCQDDGIYTRVTRLGKEKVYKIPAEDADPATSGPDWFWEPYIWSVDGDYLYLTPGYVGSIDSPWLIYSAGFGLMQLDLETGARNVLLEPYDGGYTFALSEDGRLFAYLTDVPRRISILDVKTKEKRQLNFKDNYKILEMRWTPDGARLIILTEESADGAIPGGFSVFEYSMEGQDLTKLVDRNDLDSLYSPDPSAEPRVYISDLTNEVLYLSDTLQEDYFQVNLRNGDVVQTNDLGTPMAAP